MKIPEGAVPETDMRVLRSKISARYSQYQQRSPGRFPTLDYNTNRANYEPLRDAFEEEFYVARGLERNSPTLHIPSTNTLMLLFTETAYVPGRKILNTCWSFADGPTTAVPLPPPASSRPVYTRPTVRYFVIALAIAVGLTGLTRIVWYMVYPAPSELVLSRPTTNSVVSREVIVEGQAANAQSVWVVVRSVTNRICWVQARIAVQDSGYWIGVVYIGNPGTADSGYPYELRAFVEPSVPLIFGGILRDWPEARLSTPAIRIIRGPLGK